MMRQRKEDKSPVRGRKRDIILTTHLLYLRKEDKSPVRGRKLY